MRDLSRLTTRVPPEKAPSVADGEDEVDSSASISATAASAAAVVYVPAHRTRGKGDGSQTVEPGIGIELRRDDAGVVMAIAFTTIEKLVEVLGPYQPWIPVNAARFFHVMRAAGVPPVFDPALDPSAARWTAADVETYIRGTS